MKNVRFFSNKIVLVAIVVVSSIMMMSFKSTSTKKELAYSVKVEKRSHSNVQGATPNLTSAFAWTVRAVIWGGAAAYHGAVNALEDYVGTPMGCYTPDYLRIQEDDQAKQDKKMSEF